MPKKYFAKDQKIIFSNQWMKLKEKIVRTGSKSLKYYLVERPNYVAIAPVFKNKIILISQQRFGADKVIKNIPMGLLEKGEDPKKAAQRELEEETGIKAKKDDLEKLGEFYIAPSFTSIKGHLFIAHCHNERIKTDFSDEEKHEVRDINWYPINSLSNTDEIDLTTQLVIAIIRGKLADRN